MAACIPFSSRHEVDVGGLDEKKYILLSEKLDEVGRKLGGWIRGMKSKSPAK